MTKLIGQQLKAAYMEKVGSRLIKTGIENNFSPTQQDNKLSKPNQNPDTITDETKEPQR